MAASQSNNTGATKPTNFSWNFSSKQFTTTNCIEKYTNFKFVFEADPMQFTSLANIVPVNESNVDEPEELKCSDMKPKETIYNIVQSKQNLLEKRGPKFQCHVCHNAVHTRLSMTTHMKMHMKPFCEVCFCLFESKDAVHRHVISVHPEVVIRDSTSPSKDFYALQTIAPPNTPTNPVSDDEMRAIENLINPISIIPQVVADKLLSKGTSDKAGLSIGKKLQSHVGALQTNVKRAKKKPMGLRRKLKRKQPRSSVAELTKPDNILKKITSRFGRAISLKVPQYY